MAADQTVNLQFVIDAQDKSDAAFDGAAKKVDGLKGRIEGMRPAFAGMAAAGGVALGAVSAFAIKAIKDYSEVEAAQKKLEQAVIAVSHGTRQQVDDISKLTQELEKKGVVDADSLKVGAAQLSTFGLSTKMVQALIPSLADLTVNQAGVNAASSDFEASANIMAKALNGQFGVLEKSGIRFTDAQKKMIQFGTETQRTSALQEGFAQNLKYTNETAAQTVEGGLAKLHVQLGNISENVGQALIPALTKLMDKIVPVIAKVVEWTEANPKLTMYILGGVAALGALLAVVGAVGLALPIVITGVTTLGTALLFLATNPIVLTVAALAAVAAVIYKCVEAYKALKGQQDEMRRSAEQGIDVNNRLAASLDKIADPARRARVAGIVAETQKALETSQRAANSGFFKNLGVGLGLTSYDTGGLVPGPVGAPQLAIVHGGEYVSTADEVKAAKSGQGAGGWGPTYNFVFNGDISDREALIRTIKNALSQDLNKKLATPQ